MAPSVWFPKNTIGNNAMTGLFGVKAGTRFQHFGLFAKVRPGFLTFDNALREETILVTPGPLFPIGFYPSLRFGRLTQPALDLGGVAEYYPARHWAFRWDMGDTLVFQEKGPTSTSSAWECRLDRLSRSATSAAIIFNSARACTIGFEQIAVALSK